MSASTDLCYVYLYTSKNYTQSSRPKFHLHPRRSLRALFHLYSKQLPPYTPRLSSSFFENLSCKRLRATKAPTISSQSACEIRDGYDDAVISTRRSTHTSCDVMHVLRRKGKTETGREREGRIDVADTSRDVASS